MGITKLTPLKTAALARLKVTALRSGSPVDDGVAQALEQNNKLAAAIEQALKQFKADWCEQEPLVSEAETFVRKHEGAKKEDVANQTTATVGCFLKYLDVPEGTIDNVSLDNNKEPSEGGDTKAIDPDADTSAGDSDDSEDEGDADGENGDDTEDDEDDEGEEK